MGNARNKEFQSFKSHLTRSGVMKSHTGPARPTCPEVPVSSVPMLCTSPARWALSSCLGYLIDPGGIAVLVLITFPLPKGPKPQKSRHCNAGAPERGCKVPPLSEKVNVLNNMAGKIRTWSTLTSTVRADASISETVTEEKNSCQFCCCPSGCRSASRSGC